jgi:hypothetical protein
MNRNHFFDMKEQVLDCLMQGADLDAQGYQAKAAARIMLTEAAQLFYTTGGGELVKLALPITRRLIGNPDWATKLDLLDLTNYCVTKLPDYPTGAESQHPGVDVQAEYLSACAEEYVARW